MPWNDNSIKDEDEVKELRDKLRDYYGTAMTSGFPMAVIDLGNVDKLTDEEVREEIRKNRIKKEYENYRCKGTG